MSQFQISIDNKITQFYKTVPSCLWYTCLLKGTFSLHWRRTGSKTEVMGHLVTASVLFCRHVKYLSPHISLGTGWTPSERPLQLGNLLGQTMQFELVLGQRFWSYSPKNMIYLNSNIYFYGRNILIVVYNYIYI